MSALDRCRPGPWPIAAVMSGALTLATAAFGLPLGAPSDRYYVYQLDNISTANAVVILKTLNVEVVPLGTPGTDAAGTDGDLGRPAVIELPDSDPAVTSLVKGMGSLGGNPLAGPTVGEPQQRLLIVWDAADPESLEILLDLLRERIDVRAKQILIEAVVLEMDRDKVKDLGVSFEGRKDGQSVSFLESGGFATPFTYVFERPSVKTLLNLNVTLDALVTEGYASILSQPSIMVLDGRQARIKVGDNIPYTEVAASTFELESQIVTGTKYIETGITLNLRPRAAEDDSEVTMQVETLISTPAGTSIVVPQTGTLLGPEIQTREVQTLVRVANNTPFIIGGLIAEDERNNKSGIPGLSKIPGIGKLFRRTNRARSKQEVIVVITPHILPLADRSFSYSVGKDFENLDHFDLTLFRNVYRIKRDDVFDLGFIKESDLYHSLQRATRAFARRFEKRATDAGWAPVPPGDTAALARQMRRAVAEQPEFMAEIREAYPELEASEPLIQLFEGGIPGEEILVKRMLLAIVEKLGFGRWVQPENVLFFDAAPAIGEDAPAVLELEDLLPRLVDLGPGCTGRTLRMLYPRQPDGLGEASADVSFGTPGAVVDDSLTLADRGAYLTELRRLNRLGPDGRWDQHGVLLNDCYRRGGQSTFEVLRSVLALKQVLDVNPSLPLTLDKFYPGRKVVFPSAEDLAARKHVVDREVAALFYETVDYYHAFEKSFALARAGVEALAKRLEAENRPVGP